MKKPKIPEGFRKPPLAGPNAFRWRVSRAAQGSFDGKKRTRVLELVTQIETPDGRLDRARSLARKILPAARRLKPS